MTSAKISKLTSGGTVAATDELVIARGGNNYKLTASQINELGLTPANNLIDVADAATSLSNLGGVSLAGIRAMQLYSPTINGQIIIVDNDGTGVGNGDYAFISDAVAAASSGDAILVMSHWGEFGSITIDKSISIVIGPGINLFGGVFVPAIVIQSPNVLKLSGMGGSSVTGSFGNGVSLTGAGTATLDARNIYISASAGSNAVVVNNALNRIRSMATHFGSPWDSITNGLSVPGAIDAQSYFFNSHFGGNGKGATSSVAWANAPFYNCSFKNGRTNITFAGGNVSNVDF